MEIQSAILLYAINEIDLPDGADILSASEHKGKVHIWFRCDPDQPAKKRTFVVCGLRSPAPTPQTSQYIGSMNLSGSMLHVFEKIQPGTDNAGR